MAALLTARSVVAQEGLAGLSAASGLGGFAGGGIGVHVPVGGRVALRGMALAGSLGGSGAARAETVVVLEGGARRGRIAPWLGGGVQLTVRSGGNAELLVVSGGMRIRTSRRASVFLEAGAGGGARVLAGWMVRLRN